MQNQASFGRLENHGTFRPISHYPLRFTTRLLLGDIAMLVLSGVLATAMVLRFGHDVEPLGLLVSSLASGAIWLAIFAYAGLYRRSFALTWHDEIYWVAAVSILAILPQLLLYTVMPHLSMSRLLLVIELPLDIALISALRAISRRHWERKGMLRTRLAFLGTPRELQAAEARFGAASKAETLLLPVPGWSNVASEPAGVWSAQFARWFLSAKQWGADRIVFTRLPARSVMNSLILASVRYRIPIAFVSRKALVGNGDFEIDHLGSESMLVPILPKQFNLNADLHKRAIDLAFGIAGLALFGPVMLAAAIAVYLESGGPVFYHQERVGRYGKPFHILKFRSMRTDAEQTTGAVWATANDPRVTRVGKFLRRTSLDELPQIFNVLRGEMSIVGPRPERPVFVERFRRELERYDERHVVRPGITGWSHVYMSRDVAESAIAERLDYDLFYIEHWTPTMDLSIIFKTAAELFMHRIAA